MKDKVLIPALVLLILGLSVAVADAQRPPSSPRAPAALAGTAFTYQGQLKNNGALINGSCDLQFSVWDGADAGTVLATLIKNAVSITNGVFTVQLNYGSTDINGNPLWNGNARWVSIAVRCPAGDGNFTSLTPRQALTPAPYALALPGMYTQQNITSTNIIGGFSGNSVTYGVVGATISGGGRDLYRNRVTDQYGTIGGGEANLAGDDAGQTNSAIFATVSGGADNRASGGFATVGGGFFNTASGIYASVPGGAQAVASHFGEMAYASGRFSNDGDAQSSVYVLRNQTFDATQTELFLDGNIIGGHRITIASNRTLVFDILVVARSAGGNSAGYYIRGVIERVGATTSFIGSPSVTTLGEDRPAWSVTVNDDNDNDALVILVTGEAGFDIHWVATVRTAEVAH